MGVEFDMLPTIEQAKDLSVVVVAKLVLQTAKELEHDFKIMDADGSGTLEASEVNDALAVYGHFFDVTDRTNANHTAARTICVNDAPGTVNRPACGKVRCWNNFHQFRELDVRIPHDRNATINDFTQVMRWNVRCHTHCNSR